MVTNREPVETTPYRVRDWAGADQAVHLRIETAGGKRFVWQRPDGSSGLDGRPVTSLPLYGTESLREHGLDEPVYLVEGEKAADALRSAGFLSVGTVTGAAAIPDDDVLAILVGREVRLWPDNDPPGRDHMGRIFDQLVELGASPSIVDWSAAPDHGDAADFLDDGNTALDVVALPIRSAPIEIDGWVQSIRALSNGVQNRHALGSTLRGAERILPFRTAREFADSTPQEVGWLAKPWVAVGSITGIDGKIKSAGKTTLTTYLCRAVVEGRDFLGVPTHRTGVVYLTEQPPTSLRETLRRADLLDRDDFTLLTWRDCAGIPWVEVVEAAVRECDRRVAGLLVIDTLSRFAGIHGDGENDAGQAEAAMAPLQIAAANGLAVVVIRHERKAGGEVGDSGRGSTAFGGAADVILAIRRSESGPTVRKIHSLSRFDETPDTLGIELTAAGYVALGDASALALREAQAKLREVLPVDPSGALSMRELQERTGLSRTTIQRALERLDGQAAADQIGTGRKGDPFRWWASSVPEGTDGLVTLLAASLPWDDG